MQHAATEGDGMEAEHKTAGERTFTFQDAVKLQKQFRGLLAAKDRMLRDNCRIARNRGFVAGLAVGIFVFTTVLVVLAVLR